jgi:hypothetical protein
MRVFGGLDVRLDPWQVDYGPEHPLDADEDQASEAVKVDVEVPEDDWAPILPPDGWRPAEWLFVDGVRRAEARVVVKQGTVHGVFGSWGVGAVRSGADGASFGEHRIGRNLALGDGLQLPDDVVLPGGVAYQPISVSDSGPDAPLRGIHNQMRAAEEALVRELSAPDDALVVVEGPLGFDQPDKNAVGFVKRLHRLYVPDHLIPVLTGLPAGHRTPLMALQASRRFSRYAWFLRLVRLEVGEKLGAAAAARLANATARGLGRFVASRGRDPRAPQNLMPIGALEGHLRRLLGDQTLLRRRIEGVVAREALKHVD